MNFSTFSDRKICVIGKDKDMMGVIVELRHVANEDKVWMVYWDAPRPPLAWLFSLGAADEYSRDDEDQKMWAVQ